MRNLMTGCLLAAFLCAASCGCSKDNGGGEEGGQVAGVTVKPAYNKSEVLHNPLNGWVMYVSADYDPSYFDKEIYVPLLGKNVRVADYASPPATCSALGSTRSTIATTSKLFAMAPCST